MDGHYGLVRNKMQKSKETVIIASFFKRNNQRAKTRIKSSTNQIVRILLKVSHTTHPNNTQLSQRLVVSYHQQYHNTAIISLWNLHLLAYHNKTREIHVKRWKISHKTRHHHRHLVLSLILRKPISPLIFSKNITLSLFLKKSVYKSTRPSKNVM